MKTVRACVVGLFFSAFSFFNPASATDYPKGPIRFINASSAGGVSDIFIRAVADRLSEKLKQPVIIDNRPGGAFNIATRACSESPADGYTFCVLPGDVFIFNPLLFKNLPFDADQGVSPVMTLFFIPQVLAVGANLGIKSIDQLVAVSKAKPNSMSYSSPGLAHTAFVESFVKGQKGADLVKVPFRGGGDAVNAIMTGATPLAFIGVGNLVGQFEAGTVEGLVVDSQQRVALLPQVPTLREVGFTGDMVRPFYALFAPPRTPEAMVDLVRREVAGIIGDPEFTRRNVVARGLAPAEGTLDELKRMIQEGRAVAPRVVEASGLKPQ